MGSTRVAALIAAHNRRDLTLACLRSLDAQRVPGVTVDAFVLDDGSSDGTSEAIAEQFPEVTVLHGDGQLYWNGGMRRAFAAAIAGDYDHYLWLNDDVYLDDGALAVLLDTERRLRERGDEAVIVAGSTRHPDTGELTYGGVVHPHRWRPLRSELVEPGDAPRPCDTMNGQAVLISRAVVQRIGNIDPAFVQLDGRLRLRASRPGGRLLGLGRPRDGRDLRVPSGATARTSGPWGRSCGVSGRCKELKPGPWAVYSRRWAGRLWPMYWLSPYVRRGVSSRPRAHTATPHGRGQAVGPALG